MNISKGVYVQVTLKEDISTSYHFYNCRRVYDFLNKRFGHNLAGKASSWVELACVGDIYEDDDIEIEIMEGD